MEIRESAHSKPAADRAAVVDEALVKVVHPANLRAAVAGELANCEPASERPFPGGRWRDDFNAAKFELKLSLSPEFGGVLLSCRTRC